MDVHTRSGLGTCRGSYAFPKPLTAAGARRAARRRADVATAAVRARADQLGASPGTAVPANAATVPRRPPPRAAHPVGGSVPHASTFRLPRKASCCAAATAAAQLASSALRWSGGAPTRRRPTGHSRARRVHHAPSPRTRAAPCDPCLTTNGSSCTGDAAPRAARRVGAQHHRARGCGAAHARRSLHARDGEGRRRARRHDAGWDPSLTARRAPHGKAKARRGTGV